MSVDWTTEPLIPFADVPKLPWIPRWRLGKKLYLATVHRWAQQGIKGIRLEYLEVGHCKVTSQSALIRFFKRLADAEALTHEEPGRKQDLVEKQLDAAGFKQVPNA